MISAKQLASQDPQLSGLDFEKYNKLASDESIQKTKDALDKKGHKAYIANNKEEALEAIKKLIPEGVSVMNAASTTLQEIGFVEHFKTQTAWKNVHAEVLAETDMAKQAEKRRLSMTSDYFLTSCSAVTEEGDILLCDLTGTRTGAFSTARNLVVVLGSNKVVANLDAAFQREREFCLALESARVRIAYKVPGSSINNQVIIRGGNPFSPVARVHVVIIKEALGY